MTRTSRGFALVEVLIATTLLTVAVGVLAQLVTIATRMTAASKSATVATLLAAQKMEQLRAAAGADPGASPADALARDVPGFSDHVDGFVRRWSIAPLPAAPGTTLVLQVLVQRESTECRLVTLKTRRRTS